jgi:hypothetical protein
VNQVSSSGKTQMLASLDGKSWPSIKCRMAVVVVKGLKRVGEVIVASGVKTAAKSAAYHLR